MGSKPQKHSDQGVSRFSVSLPPDLLERLDQVVAEQRMPSRSAAIAEMVHQHLVAPVEVQDGGDGRAAVGDGHHVEGLGEFRGDGAEVAAREDRRAQVAHALVVDAMQPVHVLRDGGR